MRKLLSNLFVKAVVKYCLGKLSRTVKSRKGAVGKAVIKVVRKVIRKAYLYLLES